jgi:hypothetical protein
VAWANDCTTSLINASSCGHAITRSLPHEGKWLRIIISLPRHREPDPTSTVLVFTFGSRCPSHAPPSLDTIHVGNGWPITTENEIGKMWEDWKTDHNDALMRRDPAVLLTWITLVEQTLLPSPSSTSPILAPPSLTTSPTSVVTNGDIRVINPSYSGGYVRAADSEFIARVYVNMTSLNDVKDALQSLKVHHDRRATWATHNIVVYHRVMDNEKKTLVNGCDEDGEYGAGSRLQLLLDCYNVNHLCVIVTRWFGGVLLGPSRFNYITGVAERALTAHGFSMTPANVERWKTQGISPLPADPTTSAATKAS